MTLASSRLPTQVHYDEPPPYYTVSIDGAERSTVREKLTPIVGGDATVPVQTTTATDATKPEVHLDSGVAQLIDCLLYTSPSPRDS